MFRIFHLFDVLCCDCGEFVPHLFLFQILYISENMGAVHQPGPLKQSNKKHKTGRHRSKGAVDAATGGKLPLLLKSLKPLRSVFNEK